MTRNSTCPKIPLPKHWNKYVRSAVLHVISLAQFSLAYTRGWAANSMIARVRLKAQLDQAMQEVAWLREEVRIKDARMARIPAKRRPYYGPVERMSILELKAARGWSMETASDRFLVGSMTISSWHKRIDEDGPNALVQLRVPVNRFPDFVRYMVQRLKVLCPHMGKVKIAQMLCRAGLHLAPSTVGRILKEEPAPKPKAESAGRVVTAKRPNHVWNTDLTLVPIVRGFWSTWFPFALPQRWPFCWWVGCVVDHYSRRVMGFQIFRQQPSSRAMCKFLDRTIQKAGTAPRYIISDKGVQFWCGEYKDWCKLRGIRPRFGAIGMHGSIAVIERCFRSLKSEGTRRITVASRRRDFREQFTRIIEWFNGFRPHTYLNGRTPNEVYNRRHPKSRYPRHEPRENWPRGAPNAGTHVPIRGKCGVRLELEVTYHGDQKHLPIVTIKRAA